MLQTIRNKSKNWAWLIVVIISVPFAFWGIERFQTDDTDEVIFTVGERDISRMNFSRNFIAQKRQLEEQYADEYNSRVDEEALKQQVFQRLILSGMIESAAEEFGYVVNDGQLAQYIKSQSVFQDADGQFDLEQYKTFLNLNGFSPNIYESEIRWNLKSNQIRESLIGSNLITKYEIEQFYEISSHEREFAWVLIPWRQELTNVSVEPEEAQAYYSENQSAFTVPEKVKIDYIELDADALAEAIKVSDEQAEAYYADNEESFRTAEERRARHILFELEDKALAEEVLASLNAGADFSELAEQHSIDAASAESGGDLGFFKRGIMVPSFDLEVFGMEIGDLSELVETQFGYHIIQLDDIKAGEQRSFAEVIDEVKDEFKKNQALEAFFTLQEQMATAAFENTLSLEPIAEIVQLPIQTTDWFTREEGTELAENSNIRNAAFSDEVKAKENNSQLIELSPTRVAVIRVSDTEAAFVKPFESVEQEINGELIKQKGSDLLVEKTSEMITKLQGDEALWTDVSTTFEISTGSLEFAFRSVDDAQSNLEEVIFDNIFQLPRPFADKPPLYLARRVNTGDVLMVALRASKPADIKELEDKQQELQELLLGFQRDNDRIAILEYLQSKYEIDTLDIAL